MTKRLISCLLCLCTLIGFAGGIDIVYVEQFSRRVACVEKIGRAHV